jgi:hypothetical protein
MLIGYSVFHIPCSHTKTLIDQTPRFLDLAMRRRKPDHDYHKQSHAHP